MTELISAVAAVVAVFLGIVTYIVQKSVERSNQLTELRRRHYLNFIEKNMAISQRLDESTSFDLMNAVSSIAVVGSDDVVRTVGAYYSFLKTVATPVQPADQNRMVELLTDSIFAMRRDCFERSKISAPELTSFLPYQRAA
ncbi:MAG: hypothetical protein HY765_09575 [Rhodomicrobium sp.]|nr:hypothetical protein [Rhodomicrobium sp.]